MNSMRVRPRSEPGLADAGSGRSRRPRFQSGYGRQGHRLADVAVLTENYIRRVKQAEVTVKIEREGSLAGIASAMTRQIGANGAEFRGKRGLAWTPEECPSTLPRLARPLVFDKLVLPFRMACHDRSKGVLAMPFDCTSLRSAPLRTLDALSVPRVKPDGLPRVSPDGSGRAIGTHRVEAAKLWSKSLRPAGSSARPAARPRRCSDSTGGSPCRRQPT